MNRLLFFLLFLGPASCLEERPAIYDLLVPSKLVEGRKFLLACHLNSGKQPVAFTWFHSDKLVRPGGNIAIVNTEESSQLTIKAMGLADSGPYVCKVENAYGSDSRRVDLKLNGKL